jgi:lipopolysaccharide transport protein LptA
VLAMLIFLTTAAAAEPAHPADNPLNQKLKESDSPWKFHCDEIKGLGKKDHRSFCRGHVAITRDDLTITCDTLETLHDDKWGAKKMTCLENVVLKSKDGRTTSEKAEFDNESRDLVLTGNPVLYQGGSVIRGEVIKYNLNDEQFDVKKFRGVVDQSSSMPTAKAPASRPAKK